jgi:hypothetical protein
MLKSFTFELDEMTLGTTAKQAVLMQLSSKRSFDSLETVAPEDLMDDERCSSPPLSPEKAPLLRLVSPDMLMQDSPNNTRRRVTFSEAPPMALYPSLVSPDVSSDELENDIGE